MKCTLCHTPLSQAMDSYYFNCHTCRALIKNKEHYLSDEAEKATYELHNNDVNDIRYRKFVSPITTYISENYTKKTLGLDFGCGAAPVVTTMLKEQGFDIKPYDPYFCCDTEYLNHRYDYIVCCEVAEHFHYPATEIEKLIGLLKSAGELIIHTMLYHNGIAFKNWHYRRDDTHVIIYTKETMEYIASMHQLSITKMDGRLIVLKKGRNNSCP